MIIIIKQFSLKCCTLLRAPRSPSAACNSDSNALFVLVASCCCFRFFVAAVLKCKLRALLTLPLQQHTLHTTHYTLQDPLPRRGPRAPPSPWSCVIVAKEESESFLRLGVAVPVRVRVLARLLSKCCCWPPFDCQFWTTSLFVRQVKFCLTLLDYAWELAVASLRVCVVYVVCLGCLVCVREVDLAYG